MSTAASKQNSGQQSAAALSPFPPIADYGGWHGPWVTP